MRGDGKNDRHAGKRRGHRGGRLRWAAAEKGGKGQPSGLHQQGAWRCGAGAGAQRRNLLHVHGERGTLASSGELLLIISLVLGTLAGEALRIDDRLNGLSGLVERRLPLSGFAQSFVNGALIYCVGAMAIIGALNDGLRGDASVLYIKSLLDGISSVVLGATLGPGVIFAALPVLVYQGSISLLAGALEPFLAGELLGQICGVGYCLVLCIGINFLGMTKIKTANMLPALLVPVLWSFLQPLFSGAA